MDFIKIFNLRSHKNPGESDFKLPIQYRKTYDLNPVVLSDLELMPDASGNCMYTYLMQPEDHFSHLTVKKWSSAITTDTDFLIDTQEIVSELVKIENKVEADKVMDVWKTTKMDADFLSRYSYIEFEKLQSLNTNPTFLQIITLMNMTSPILSFFIPVLMLIMPFIILKIQGVPIGFGAYLGVLREIAKHHFIGKMVRGADNFGPHALIYMLGLIGMYFYQLYTNYMACKRFFENLRNINERLVIMQKYLVMTEERAKVFCELSSKYSTYAEFTKNLQQNRKALQSLYSTISCIRPFSPSFSKVGEIGNLLQCYYVLYSNEEFEKELLWSFEFNGYYENMYNLAILHKNGIIGSAEYEVEGPTQLTDMYYPALKNDPKVVKNHFSTENGNTLLSGPNAAGKTTYLKTVVLNIVFSQQVGFGFYKSASIVPYTHIHSYLNIPDTSGRDSLFQAESRRCKEILDIIEIGEKTEHHFAMFDELFSGTNPVEATKSAYAFLKYLSKFPNVDYILTTHYVQVCERLDKEDGANIQNLKMKVDEDGEFTYKVADGISYIEGAVKVLKEMNYPTEILDSILVF